MNAPLNSPAPRVRIENAGFTLIELMVTIAVMAIIAGIAAPNISTQLANQRVKSTAATFANALKEAKIESIIRRQNITVLYDTSSTPKKIILQANSINISSYNISDKSSVTQQISPSSATSVVFQPSKSMVNGATAIYTICDSASNNENAKQVNLTSIANVQIVNAGSC